ncbi:MAG: acyl-CoA dehydrogenase family protein [Alphaproteobacteria bacterium]|nr:acyl-CoA dehydrogenase family protein [Alphaproteobacteria bacterium]
MDQLNPTHLLSRARALGPELDAAAVEIERTKRMPADLLAKIHEARLGRMFLPKIYGGDEVDPCTYLDALEAVSRHDASVGWNLFVANSSALITPFLEPETARTIYAEPHAWMSWGPPDAQKAKAVDGGYIVNGTWGFSSGCRQANWMGAHCMVEEKDGSVRLNAAGRPSITSFLFPATQATLHDTWDTIGLRGTASDSYTVDKVFVPDAFTGSREEPNNRRVPGPLYWFTQQGLYAVGVAAVALGTAGAMLSAFMDLATQKSPRGQARLADRDTTRALVALSEARLGSARSYLVDVLSGYSAAAEDTGAMGVEDRAKVRLATTNAIIGAIDVADRIHKAAGVSAIFVGKNPFERRWRDIHTLSQQIQARDAHFEVVGQVMLGDPPAVFL